MEQVTFGDALLYGLSMLAYFALVGTASFFCVTAGFALIAESASSANGAIPGALIAGLGFVIAAAGSYGAIYKVIADGVQRGVSRADVSPQRKVLQNVAERNDV